MSEVASSAIPETHNRTASQAGPNIWGKLKTMGTNVAAGAALLVAEAGTISADPPLGPKLTPPEIERLVRNLGDVYHIRQKAHDELARRLDYNAMLLLAPHSIDPVLERKRRVEDILDKRSSDIFMHTFPIPPKTKEHWLYPSTGRPYSYTGADGCKRYLHEIASVLDQRDDVKKADATEKTDWENYRLKLVHHVQTCDLEERKAVPLWDKNVVKQYQDFLKNNPAANRDQWNKTRVDARMKKVTDATNTRVQFFGDESDAWRLENKHPAKQPNFVRPRASPRSYNPDFDPTTPHAPPGFNFRGRMPMIGPKLKVDAGRRGYPERDLINDFSAIHSNAAAVRLQIQKLT